MGDSLVLPLSLILALILAAVACSVCCACICTDESTSQGEEPLSLPLLPNVCDGNRNPRYRLEAASRDALAGFNRCSFCGFENFTRHVFCNLCGSQIVVQQQKKKSSRDELAVELLGELPPSAAQREKRARGRKDWTRKLDVEGRVFWFQAPKKRSTRVFVGYVAYFISEADIPTLEEISSGLPPTDATAEAPSKVTIEVLPPETATQPAGVSETPAVQPSLEQNAQKVLVKEAVAQSLSMEASFQTLLLTESTAVDAARMPLEDNYKKTEERRGAGAAKWKQILKLASQDFPTKYAHFVRSAADLLVDASQQYVKMSIRREQLVADSMEALSVIPRTSIHSAMRLEFLDERGVDAGALQREWLMILTQALADPTNGVFQCVDVAEQIFYLNSGSVCDIGEDHLMYYFATGRLVGRSLLEGQVLNFHLALPLLKIILGLPLMLTDLEYFDKEAFRSLKWIMDNDGADDLGITFSVTEKRGDDKMVVVDLIDDGR
ncbi:Hect e3 ubiquitin, partial [Globisporangium polare]